MSFKKLNPHGIQKDFYGKAMVTDIDGNLCLFSYDTMVAWWDGKRLHRSWWGWSATTSKHVKAFCLEVGTDFPCKKQWDKMTVETMP